MIQKGGYVKDILSKEPGTRLDAYGWVKTRRDSKGVHFVQIQDGSSPQDLQVVIEEGRIPEEKLAQITTGAALRVSGELVKSPAAGQAVERRINHADVASSFARGVQAIAADRYAEQVAWRAHDRGRKHAVAQRQRGVNCRRSLK